MGRITEHEDDEDEHERADHLGDGVPRVIADLRDGRERRPLENGVELLLIVVLIGEPGDYGAEERADELAGEIHEDRGEVHRHTLDELLLTGDGDTDGDRGVEMCPRPPRRPYACVDGETPAPGDEVPSTGVQGDALGLRQ